MDFSDEISDTVSSIFNKEAVNPYDLYDKILNKTATEFDIKYLNDIVSRVIIDDKKKLK